MRSQELGAPLRYMSGSSLLNAPGRVLDATVLVLAALLGAVVYPPTLPFIAAGATLFVLIFALPNVLSLHRKIGVAGWLALASAIWLTIAGIWGQGGVGSPAIWLLVFAFLGVPAVSLADTTGLKKVGTDIAIVATLVLGGLVVFETASDGFLADTVFGTGFLAVYSTVAILTWPVAALIRAHYGWREAALWAVVISAAVILGATPAIAYGMAVGLLFLGLGLLSALLARFILVFLIVTCAMLPPVLAFADISIAGLGVLGTAEAWGALVERWTAAPAHGLGPGTFADGVSSIYGTLLLGTGAIGYLLVCFTLGFAAITAVQKTEGGWAGAASAGLIAVLAVAGLWGLGPFSEWWMASLVVASLALAICHAPDSPEGASLGSIFGSGTDAAEEADEPFDRLDDEEEDFLDEDEYEDDDEEYDEFDDEDDDELDPEDRDDEDDDGFDEEDGDEDDPPEEWNLDPAQFDQDPGKDGR